MKQFVTLALVLAVAGCAFNNAPDNDGPFAIHTLPIPDWSRLHVGMKVYLSEDGLGPDKTQAVCESVRDFRRALHRQKAHCTYHRYGTEADVTSIIPSQIQDWYYPVPLVTLTALNRTWKGITSVLSLQPDIPAGAVLMMTQKQYPIGLAPCRTSCATWGPDIGTHIRVKVLKYDPVTYDGTPLYVKVLDGEYAGKTGWVFMRDTEVAESMNSVYGITYGSTPELTAGFKHLGD